MFMLPPQYNSGGRPSRWALPRFLVPNKFTIEYGSEGIVKIGQYLWTYNTHVDKVVV